MKRVYDDEPDFGADDWRASYDAWKLRSDREPDLNLDLVPKRLVPQDPKPPAGCPHGKALRAACDVCWRADSKERSRE